MPQILEYIDKKELHTYIYNTEFSNETKEAIEGMIGVVLSSGENDVNLDLDDLKVVMSHGGMAFVGSAIYEGENSAVKAIELAIKNSSLDFSLLNKISGILLHFETHLDYPIMNMFDGMSVIHENTDPEADILWGTSSNMLVSTNYVKVTIFLAGFDKNNLTSL